MNPSERWFTPAKTVLLTGAGLTHTFGGYLASEMWAAILNQPEVRQSQKLRERMLEELNYETLYDKVLTSECPREEKDAFTKAVRNAYQQMHEVIFQPRNRSKASGMFQAFVARFARPGNERAFFFTLNHDLLVEQFYVEDGSLLRIPGVPHCPRWFKNELVPALDHDSRVQLPDEDTVKEEKAQFWDKKAGQPFVYIKLHGSYGWYSKRGKDVMVIGHTKTEIIENEPLLRWYWELFNEVLRSGDRSLVVIGYGFGDEHINDAIAKAIEHHGLKLYVVSPKQPKDFKQMLMSVHSLNQSQRLTPRGDELWCGLFGYYRASVTDLLIFKNGGTGLLPSGKVFFRDLGLT